MCKNVHYKFCIRVSQDHRLPPKDYHHKCEIHHALADEIRRGSRSAVRELDRHDEKSKDVTTTYHYGKTVLDDGTCIIDPKNPIIQQAGSRPDRNADVWYLRCNGCYTNAYGQVIRRASGTPRINSKGQLVFS